MGVNRKLIILTVYFDLKTCTLSGFFFLQVFLFGRSQQSNIASAQALSHRYHRYVHHVPYGRHNPSVFELKYWWYGSDVRAILRAYYSASCNLMMQYLLLCSQCGEADSYFSNLLKFFPTYLIVRPWICLHQKPLTFLILPRADHLRRYLIYALLLSDEAMTIQHTGNKNTKPLNVSQISLPAYRLQI